VIKVDFCEPIRSQKSTFTHKCVKVSLGHHFVPEWNPRFPRADSREMDLEMGPFPPPEIGRFSTTFWTPKIRGILVPPRILAKTLIFNTTFEGLSPGPSESRLKSRVFEVLSPLPKERTCFRDFRDFAENHGKLRQEDFT